MKSGRKPTGNYRGCGSGGTGTDAGRDKMSGSRRLPGEDREPDDEAAVSGWEQEAGWKMEIGRRNLCFVRIR